MSDTRSIPPTVNIPKQKRSLEKFNAMLDAAERLFAEQGIPQTSVAQIVETAGVSIGAFYQRFENKDALIHTIFYLLEEDLDQLEDVLAPVPGRSLEDTLELITSSLIGVYHAKRGVLLALLLVVQENPSIREYVATLRAKISGILTEALSVYKSEIGKKRFRSATAMSFRLLNSYLDQSIIWAGHEQTEAVMKFKTSDKELVKVMYSYLTSA